jgi:hypothetical protein
MEFRLRIGMAIQASDEDIKRALAKSPELARGLKFTALAILPEELSCSIEVEED